MKGKVGLGKEEGGLLELGLSLKPFRPFFLKLKTKLGDLGGGLEHGGGPGSTFIGQPLNVLNGLSKDFTLVFGGIGDDLGEGLNARVNGLPPTTLDLIMGGGALTVVLGGTDRGPSLGIPRGSAGTPSTALAPSPLTWWRGLSGLGMGGTSLLLFLLLLSLVHFGLLLLLLFLSFRLRGAFLGRVGHVLVWRIENGRTRELIGWLSGLFRARMRKRGGRGGKGGRGHECDRQRGSVCVYVCACVYVCVYACTCACEWVCVPKRVHAAEPYHLSKRSMRGSPQVWGNDLCTRKK